MRVVGAVEDEQLIIDGGREKEMGDAERRQKQRRRTGRGSRIEVRGQRGRIGAAQP